MSTVPHECPQFWFFMGHEAKGKRAKKREKNACPMRAQWKDKSWGTVFCLRCLSLACEY